MNVTTSGYENRKYTKLEQLYNKPSIQNILYAKRLEWAGHMWRANAKIIKNVEIRN